MGCLMRTIIYVDGFNLYYRRLRKTEFKWLDLSALFQNMLGKLDTPHSIHRINYYTANLKRSEDDPTLQDRQKTYLRALATLPNLKIHYGNFTVRRQWMRRAKPPILLYWRKNVRVIKKEEKRSDVNLCVHLLNDAWSNAFDAAVVVTDDTDMMEALRLVRAQFTEKNLYLISPKGEASPGLDRFATKSLRITNADLAAAQFSDPVRRPNGPPIYQPVEWKTLAKTNGRLDRIWAWVRRW